MRLDHESWRAEFAKAALTGICAQAELPHTSDHARNAEIAEQIARAALVVADALLNELECAPLRHPPRVLPPAACTGISASWCPRCGDCACPEDGERNSFDCPLHSPRSPHGEEPEQEQP